MLYLYCICTEQIRNKDNNRKKKENIKKVLILVNPFKHCDHLDWGRYSKSACLLSNVDLVGLFLTSSLHLGIIERLQS